MDSVKRPELPPTRCASSQPCETGRQWIREQLCTWYFNWRINDFGDESYAEGYAGSYEHYELDDFGSASGNHDGSGPAAGVRAAEPTTGCGDAARTNKHSAKRRSVTSGADHDGSG